MNRDGDPSGGDVTLSVQGVCKRYQAVSALEDVDLSVRAGEVHALLGQNGAGKSTLVRIIAGAEYPDAGRITIDGQELKPGVPTEAAAQRIAYVSQEGNLNPNFTAIENVFLGRERTRRGLLDRRGMRAEVAALVDEYGLSLALDRPIGALDPAKRKLVEIVRALALRPRLLILDEPTAALPQPDVEHLLDMVRGLATRGIGILFISHYLQEVFDVATRATVLRDGRRVWTGATADTDPGALVHHMLGKAAVAPVPVTSNPSVGAPVVSVTSLATADGVVTNADLDIHAGRVLGIFGVVGAGKSELLEAVFGLRRIETGQITITGRDLPRWGPRQAIAAGLALVPEDRLSKALLADRTIAWNVAMPYWSRLPRLAGVSRPESQIGDAVVDHLGIRAAGGSTLVSALSGGNKQKVSIGRWLGAHAKARIFLFDEPTQGLDVGARSEVYRLMAELAADGAAIVVASSDLDEVLAVSHDIVVVRNGRTIALGSQVREPAAVLRAAA